MRVSHAFDPIPSEVVGARRFVTAALTSWGIEEDDVPLMVSELATNAVIHARSEFEITLDFLRGRLRVEVTDLNTRLPVVTSVPPDAESGRGLFLIRALSASWGVEWRQDAGKTVWFEIAAG